MSNRICKGSLCGGSSQLIRAHILPAWVTRTFSDENGCTRSYTGNPHNVLRQTGEYDREILCSLCDGYIGQLDSYAKHFFKKLRYEIQRLDAMECGPHSRPIVVDSGSNSFYDFAKLKRFILSVLWRGSVSCRPALEDFRLVDAEASVRNIVFGDEPADPSLFPFMIEWLDDIDELPLLFASLPSMDLMTDGSPFCHFTMCGVRINVLVDSRAFHEPVRQVAANSKQLILVRTRFGDRGEIESMSKVIRDHSRGT